MQRKNLGKRLAYTIESKFTKVQNGCSTFLEKQKAAK